MAEHASKMSDAITGSRAWIGILLSGDTVAVNAPATTIR